MQMNDQQQSYGVLKMEGGNRVQQWRLTEEPVLAGDGFGVKKRHLHTQVIAYILYVFLFKVTEIANVGKVADRETVEGIFHVKMHLNREQDTT